MRSTCAAPLFCLACLSAAGGARAAASALVEWDAPAACPGASVLYERLSAALGYEPQTLGRLSRVRGTIVPSPGGFRLSIEVSESDRKSSRLVEAVSCDDLVEAAVLAITLALSPESAAAESGANADPLAANAPRSPSPTVASAASMPRGSGVTTWNRASPARPADAPPRQSLGPSISG